MSHGKSGSVGGAYTPPGRSNSTVQPNDMDDGDSAGVSGGLSGLQGFDGEAGGIGPNVDLEKDSLTGNANERITENPPKNGRFC